MRNIAGGLRFLFFIFPVVLLLLVYYPGFSGPFLLDDVGNIENAKVDRLDIQGIVKILTNNSSGMFGRPISALTLGVNHLLNGDNPYWYKVFNWVLHVANTGLIYLFVLMLFRASRNQSGMYSYKTKVISALIALTWALHPLQVSTVLYVVQRMAQLSTFFTLLALLFYLHGRYRLSTEGRGLFPMAVGFCIFGVLACLSKENGVLLPMYVLVIEVVVFGFKTSFVKNKAALKGFLVAFCYLPIALGLVVMVLLFDALISGYSVENYRGFSLVERLLTETVIVSGYLKTILIPDINNMNLYQDFWEIQSSFSSEVIGSVAFLFSLLVLAWLLRSSMPLATLGVLIFFVAHGLESTFLPLALAFEHRNYFALLGVLLFLGSVFLRLYEWLGIGLRTAGVSAVILVLALSFQTHSRSVEWSNERLMNAVAVENFPDSFSARTWYSVSLLKQGDVEKAREQLNYAAENIEREFAYPEVARLQLDCIAGTFSKKQYISAVDEVSNKIIDVTSLSAVLNIVQNSRNGGCDGLTDEDLNQLLQGVYENSRNSISSRMKSIVGFEYSSSLISLAKIDDARTVVNTMLAKNSNNVMALIQLGRVQALEQNANELKETLSLIKGLKPTETIPFSLPLQQLEEMHSVIDE